MIEHYWRALFNFIEKAKKKWYVLQWQCCYIYKINFTQKLGSIWVQWFRSN